MVKFSIRNGILPEKIYGKWIMLVAYLRIDRNLYCTDFECFKER